MNIDELREHDWPQVWKILEPPIRAGDSFCYDVSLSEYEVHELWVVRPPGHVAAARRGEDIIGTANMYANRPGPGSHIASGNIAVAQAARGTGVGRALGEYLLQWSSDHGFAGVQFNAVAASNVGAVRLYRSLGFALVGTVPGAFAHPTGGRVGLHVMFHDLSARRPDSSGATRPAGREPTS